MKYRNLLLVASVAALLNITSLHAEQPPAKDAATQPMKQLAMMAASMPSADLDRSIAFYTKGLGMTVAGKMEMGTVVEVPLMFPGGGAYLLLLHPKTNTTALPVRGSTNRLVLNVPDLKALEAQLKAAGYQLKGPINEVPQHHVSVAHVEDPDGNHLELVQRT